MKYAPSFSIRSFLERTVVERAKWLSRLKKTLNNAGHIDAKLIDFSKISPKKSSEIGCFLLIVSWRSFPLKFPMKSADLSKNLPLKILRNLTFFREIGRFFCEFWLFSCKNTRNRPIFQRILTFFPRNRSIFPQICPRKSHEILLFFCEISEALDSWQ